MSIRITQPISLLVRAEQRDRSEAPEGPFLVVCYDWSRNSDDEPDGDGPKDRFKEGRRFEHLCDAVASVVEGAGDIDDVIDALDVLEYDDSDTDEELEGEDEDEWEEEPELDTLPYEELYARLIAKLPQLASLKSLDYISFALQSTLKYCTDEDQSGYLQGVERAFPEWRFCIGWGAVPPLHDTGVAILMPRR